MSYQICHTLRVLFVAAALAATAFYVTRCQQADDSNKAAEFAGWRVRPGLETEAAEFYARESNRSGTFAARRAMLSAYGEPPATVEAAQ